MWDNADPARVEKDWSRYEQTAYWVNGTLVCGYPSDDAAVRERAERIVDYTLAHPDADGSLGPVQFKKSRKEGDFQHVQWPHVVTYF